MATANDYESAAQALATAAKILGIEFYCVSSDRPEESDRPALLCCRVGHIDGLNVMECKGLAAQLNAVIKPVQQEWTQTMRTDAERRLQE